MSWGAIVFFALGVVFGIMGNVGVLSFPDVYTRLHASSTCSTTSVFSVFVACMILSGFSPMTGKVLVIALFFFISNPISSHIIARYAWESGMVPWRRSYTERRRLWESRDEESES